MLRRVNMNSGRRFPQSPAATAWRYLLSLTVGTRALPAGLLAAGSVQPPCVINDPPPLELKRKPLSSRLRTTQHELLAAPNEVALDLNVIYTAGKIWNPGTQRYDRVNLRGYQGARIDPQAPYVSPTLEVLPGDTVRLSPHNKLPTDSGCINIGGDVNVPRCFNDTHLHAHSLWANPASSGDNVLVSAVKRP